MKLGRTDLEVGTLGMGCWAIGGPLRFGEKVVGWGAVDDDQSIKAIHKALDLGVVFFDTADVYGAGHSERILAKALGGQRQAVFLATKFGFTFKEDVPEITGTNASRGYISSACDASLRRLNTDVIDLYQFHLNDYESEKSPEILEEFELLVRRGKIRYYGWSTDDPGRALRLAKGEHCAGIQHQLNLLTDAPQMIALCEQERLTSIARNPLAMGFLSGKYKRDSLLPEGDVRGAKGPDWIKYFKQGKPDPSMLDKLEQVKDILTSRGRSLVQGALAWVWARSNRCLPIPGFRNAAQIEENAGSMKFGPLEPEQMKRIEEILRPRA